MNPINEDRTVPHGERVRVFDFQRNSLSLSPCMADETGQHSRRVLVAQTSDRYPGEYLKPTEVAAIMNVDRKTVYKAIHSGELPAIRVGRLLKVHRSDINALAVRPDTHHSASHVNVRPLKPVGEFVAMAKRVVQ